MASPRASEPSSSVASSCSAGSLRHEERPRLRREDMWYTDSRNASFLDLPPIVTAGPFSWPPLDDEQHELLALVRTLATEQIAPRAAEIDESHEFPWDVVELYREHAIFGLLYEERYGGLGTGPLLALT